MDCDSHPLGSQNRAPARRACPCHRDWAAASCRPQLHRQPLHRTGAPLVVPANGSRVQRRRGVAGSRRPAATRSTHQPIEQVGPGHIRRESPPRSGITIEDRVGSCPDAAGANIPRNNLAARYGFPLDGWTPAAAARAKRRRISDWSGGRRCNHFPCRGLIGLLGQLSGQVGVAEAC